MLEANMRFQDLMDELKDSDMDGEEAAVKRGKKGKGKEKASVFRAVRDGSFDELEEIQLQPASECFRH
jgi:hypothetical protein